VRIAGTRRPGTFDTFDSGPWCGQAVTAAAGWLRGLDAGRLAHAIAIAGTTAPGQTATAYTRFMGNNVKEGIPFGAANGLLAAELAAEGFTGPIDLLDDERRYDTSKLLAGLGSAWQIESVYFKPYGCCRWAHAAIDAATGLGRDEAILWPDIRAIHVETFAQALSLNNEVAPRTLEAAQYSLPFCIAAAIVRGPDSLTPIEEALLADRDVLALARRVTLAAAPDLDPTFPKQVPARVLIETGTRRTVRTVLDPRGEPTNPMTDDDLTAKFSRIARSRLAAPAAGKLLGAIAALGAGHIDPLIGVLAQTRLLAHVPA
jgi:2-methylcitrate dehydratase PrpD